MECCTISQNIHWPGLEISETARVKLEFFFIVWSCLERIRSKCSTGTIVGADLEFRNLWCQTRVGAKIEQLGYLWNRYPFCNIEKSSETVNRAREHWSLVLNYWYSIIDFIDCFPIITFNYWNDWLVSNYHFQLLMLLIGSLLAISIIDMIDCFPMITFNYWCYWCIEMEKSLLHYPSREVKYYSPIIVIRLQKKYQTFGPKYLPRLLWLVQKRHGF